MKVPASFRLYLLFFAFFSIIFPVKALANSYIFSEEFSEIDYNNWEINLNTGGSVNITDNIINLSSADSFYFPYVYLKNFQFPLSDYSISLKFKFSGSATYGSGLIFSDKILVNGTHSALELSDFIFAVWPLNSTPQVDISTTLCLVDSVNCQIGSSNHILYAPFDSWIDINIDEFEDHYKITIGDISFETTDKSRKISQFWMGNPQKTTDPQSWASFSLDYFKVINSQNSFKNRNILIPGLGGSC